MVVFRWKMQYFMHLFQVKQWRLKKNQSRRLNCWQSLNGGREYVSLNIPSASRCMHYTCTGCKEMAYRTPRACRFLRWTCRIQIYTPDGHAKLEVNARNKQWTRVGFRGWQVDFKSTWACRYFSCCPALLYIHFCLHQICQVNLCVLSYMRSNTWKNRRHSRSTNTDSKVTGVSHL